MAKKDVVATFVAEVGQLTFKTEHDKADGGRSYTVAIPLKATADVELYDRLGDLWRAGQVEVTIRKVQGELEL